MKKKELLRENIVDIVMSSLISSCEIQNTIVSEALWNFNPYFIGEYTPFVGDDGFDDNASIYVLPQKLTVTFFKYISYSHYVYYKIEWYYWRNVYALKKCSLYVTIQP